MSVLDKLTEGIVNRDLQKEGAALLNKWEKTGLLEGLDNDKKKDGMARLLENQAKELLREASSMGAGADVEGFAAVAFPIVRRVFGNLIANDLVSVQPMSLPSGLIFFLDFTYAQSGARLSYLNRSGESLYGGGKVAKDIQDGVDLSADPNSNGSSGFYNLNNGFASATGSLTNYGNGIIDSTTAAAGGFLTNPAIVTLASGTIGADAGTATSAVGTHPLSAADQNKLDRLCNYDPDLQGRDVIVVEITGSSEGNFEQLALKNLIALSGASTNPTHVGNIVRRLTKISTGSSGQDPSAAAFKLQLVFASTASNGTRASIGNNTTEVTIANARQMMMGITGSLLQLEFPIDDNYVAGGALGSTVGSPLFELEAETEIPEIDIKVDSVAVTAMTKKLKAKWTPELGQDLSAYHNLDAEVELTSILSEQIALEIDREILEDLIKGATAGTFYWSRRPGRFLTRDTGAQVGVDTSNETLMGADFTGTVSEWYETLAETINDVSAQIHRKTLRGGANFVVCSPEVANLLEFTAGFRASIGNDYAGNGNIGAVNVGSLSKKFDVYVDPYFPRNVVLVGRKGGSFLESGYVYAPYVPLQVTPTIFGVEDFVPRKGVMTRYAKKMVRPDMYGLVVCRDLLG
jgi:hypothetical protein